MSIIYIYDLSQSQLNRVQPIYNIQQYMIGAQTLNVARIRELMEQGFRCLKAPKGEREAVLVIGDTGVGKSTIISLLAGRHLVVKHNGLNTVIDSLDNSSTLKIGHDKYSETSIPTKVVIGNLDFFDCSGFKDNRGDEFQISNSFFLQRLFHLYHKVKLFLIIDEHYITQARLDKLPKLIHSLTESFNSLKEVEDGIVLLINKAKPNRDLKDYSRQLQRLTHLKGDKPLFTKDEKQFLDYLVDNQRLILFKQAEESAAGKMLPATGADILQLITQISFVKSRRIKNIISQSAKLSIRDYADELIKEGEGRFDELIKKIKLEVFKHSILADSAQIQRLTTEVLKLLQAVKKVEGCKIVDVLRSTIAGLLDDNIGKDLESMLFLQQIYDKSGSYFTILKHKLITELTIFESDLQKQLTYLKQKEQELEELKSKQIELERKLESERQFRQRKQAQAKSFEAAYKKKELDYDELKRSKQTETHEILQKLTTTQTKLEQRLAQKQIELNNIKKLYEEKLHQTNTIAETRKNQIDQLSHNFSKHKARVQQIQIQKINYATELEQLKRHFGNLQTEFYSKSQQLEEASIENESLRNQIQNWSNQSIADSMKSVNSKSSKYPDVVCPHFLNGGKCKHCIRKWKESQKEQLSQP